MNLADVVSRYVVAQQEFELCKRELAQAMEMHGESRYSYQGYTAHRRLEKRKTVQAVLLLANGVEAEKVAMAASSCNRQVLLESGVDPVTIDEASTETEFVKCYVSKDREERQ